MGEMIWDIFEGNLYKINKINKLNIKIFNLSLTSNYLQFIITNYRNWPSEMFCNNASYETERFNNNCSKYCSPNKGLTQPLSYNYLPTQQSQRNPSNLYNQQNSGRKSQFVEPKHLPHINQIEAFELINENTRRQNKKMQAVQRNNKICAIIATVLTFSQRIEVLKQKLCGYPAQSFSPVQFFNVLDITEKGYVDIYDIKRFVNNEKIREKDIIALFKKVNGDHAKDNIRLSYFGYLNLIKPYFNEQLARDLLLRDANGKGRSNRSKENSLQFRVDSQFIQSTQESVLLLFQELILLHCICTTQHEQAKQVMMNEYMLNTVQIKQIIGLDQSESVFKSNYALSQQKNISTKVKHKSPLTILFQFIENNSQFEIEFQEMKFLLSFLNVHQFSLTNDKYLSVLFMPTNCKRQILQQIKKNNQENVNLEGAQNYMNTYLTKQNLMNKGNIQIIKDYLGEQEKGNLSQQHMGMVQGTSKANFLQFVHPKSIDRIGQNHPIPAFHLSQNHHQPQIIDSTHSINEHPHFQINASNKQLNKNQRVSFIQPNIDPSYRQYSNNSSIPQQNVKLNPPRQTHIRQDYGYNSGLNNQFYQKSHRELYEQVNSSKLSNTPFLEQFMKNNNNIRIDKKYSQQENIKNINQNHYDSKITSSKISDSAFEVVDYGYEPQHLDERSKKQANKKYPDQSLKLKKQSLDSRYNLVVSQYKSSNLYGEQVKKQIKNKAGQNYLLQINDQSSYSRNVGNGSMGPKFERSTKINNLGIVNPVLDYSRGNYIQNVGLSQSNVVNQSNFMNKFYQNGGNILNQFLKK